MKYREIKIKCRSCYYKRETNPVINVDKQQISQARGGGHIKVCLEVFGSYVKSYVLK